MGAGGGKCSRRSTSTYGHASAMQVHLTNRVNSFNLGLLAGNWAHSMFGLFVPLLVALYDESACAPAEPCLPPHRCGCRCKRVVVHVPGLPSSTHFVNQLSLLQPLGLNISLHMDAPHPRTQSTELLRCDVPVALPTSNPFACSREHTRLSPLSCTALCTQEGAWAKARRMLAALLLRHPRRAALDVSRARPGRMALLANSGPNSNGSLHVGSLHVLIVRRVCDACARGELLRPVSLSASIAEHDTNAVLAQSCWFNAHHRLCQPDTDGEMDMPRRVMNMNAEVADPSGAHARRSKFRQLISALQTTAVHTQSLERHAERHSAVESVVHWELMSFDHLPMLKQLEQVAWADSVLLQHGAALANALWSRPLTRWVEMTPYLKGGSLGEMISGQRLAPGRDVLQRVVRALAPTLELEHIAIPAAPRDWSVVPGGREPFTIPAMVARRCWLWSCLQAKELAHVLTAKNNTHSGIE